MVCHGPSTAMGKTQYLLTPENFATKKCRKSIQKFIKYANETILTVIYTLFPLITYHFLI